MFVSGIAKDTKKTTKWNLTLCLVGRGEPMTNLIKNLQDFTCTDCGENYQSLYAYINDNGKVSCFHCKQENQ